MPGLRAPLNGTWPCPDSEDRRRKRAASADTSRLPSCASVSVRARACVCSAEVAADLQGKMFQEEHFALERDLKHGLWIKVGPSLICATLFDHLCFPEHEGLKIMRSVNRKWMEGWDQCHVNCHVNIVRLSRDFNC